MASYNLPLRTLPPLNLQPLAQQPLPPLTQQTLPPLTQQPLPPLTLPLAQQPLSTASFTLSIPSRPPVVNGSKLQQLSNLWANSSYEQINKLYNLRYVETNQQMIVDTDNELLKIVISMLRNLGFDKTYDFLSSVKNRKEIIWNQEKLYDAKTKYARELHLLRFEPAGVSGIDKCKYCGSDEVTIATIQLRSGDEPATVVTTCLRCKKTWKY